MREHYVALDVVRHCCAINVTRAGVQDSGKHMTHWTGAKNTNTKHSSCFDVRKKGKELLGKDGGRHLKAKRRPRKPRA